MQTLDDAMKTIIQDAGQREIGCFVKGTSVRVEGPNRFSYKPIQDIEVGDKVLSAPENGIGEPVFKRVTKTFKFEDKEIWYVGFIDITRPALTDVRDIEDIHYAMTPRHVGVTPNHHFMIVGKGYHTDRDRSLVGPPEDLALLDTPEWRRADQLTFGDVLLNPENGNHYAVIAAKPLYQYGSDQVDNMAWMHATPYYAHAVEDTEDMEESLSKGTLFNMDDINEYFGAFRYADISCDNYNVTTHDDGTESYIPYTTTVYNLEVEDYHTYCIGGTYQIMVHNTNCGTDNSENFLLEYIAPKRMLGDSLSLIHI